MNILITGGFGYLGGRLAQFLVANTNDKILLGSRKDSGSPVWLPQAKVVQTLWDSQLELEKICKGVDTIVHMAGMNAQDCSSDPIAALEINAVATARIIQAAIRQNVKRFIYLSTAHVYDSPLSGTISEETCPVNLHSYASSHRAGEDVVKAAHQHNEIEGVVIRLSNSFGAPVHIDANCWMLLVNDLCRQAVQMKTLILRSSGEQKRDFISLTDACRAIGHLINLPAGDLGDGIYNIGGGWCPTILDMAQRITERFCTVTGQRIKVQFKEEKNPAPYEYLDYRITKLKKTGFIVSQNVNEEIDGLIKFCIKNNI